MIDLDNTEEVIEMMVVKQESLPAEKENAPHYLLVSTEGRGFRVCANHILSQTRNGRQVMVLTGDAKAVACLPIVNQSTESSNLIAIIGENRKLVIFPVMEIPALTRGRGVTLQKYRQGTMSDIKIFPENGGLTWCRNGKLLKETDLRPWTARRGAIGRLAPIGFPRNNKFEG